MIIFICILIIIAITKYFNKVLTIDTEFFPIEWKWRFSIDYSLRITMCFFALVITFDDLCEEESEEG